MNILLVEDDRSIGSFIRRGIEKAGHLLDWTPEGRIGIEYATLFDYDAVILDLMLPDTHGYDVCREMRRQRWDLPIIILSECDQVSDRIQGLSAGADDYLVKPFVFDELLARLSAIQRRKAPRPPDGEAADTIILDRDSRTVTYAGRSVEVTTREFQLLEFLMKNADRVVSRASVRSQVWGAEADISNNAVDVYIGYLRKKIGLNSRLRTVRGLGFKLSSA